MAMTRKQKRLTTIAGIGLVLALSLAFILVALRQQLLFSVTPSQVAEFSIQEGTPIRLTGMVMEGSWQREGENNTFVVFDDKTQMTMHYTGIVPDLFREGQSVTADGAIQPDGSFRATKVLAKHDEYYVPREMEEVAERMRAAEPGESSS